eukprot:scaffold77453_cov72-Phaeocystis_antarctica.AAC.9
MKQYVELLFAEGGNDATHVDALRAGDPLRGLQRAYLAVALLHGACAFHVLGATLLLQQRRHECHQRGP